MWTPVDNVRPWTELIKRHAGRFELPRHVVGAIISQESGGIWANKKTGASNPYAVRVERGFWRRYLEGIRRIVLNNGNSADDRWLNFPDFASASYGLMQVMWPTALEYHSGFLFPTELCDPDLNIEIGCRHLAKLVERRDGLARGILAYNGGGDPTYPDKINAIARQLALTEIW